MKSVAYGDLLKLSTEAARKAGSHIMSNLGGITSSDIVLKQTSDFVTRVDKESETLIVNLIRSQYSDHSIVAEESVNEEVSGYRWIIDPLDGTTNFIHGYPVFSVSIAVEHAGNIITGVVFDPTRDEMFTAAEGSGAHLNDRPIAVSKVNSIADSLITTGFPFRRKDHIDKYLSVFKEMFMQVSDIRRAGSAALDLSYLACGRCDGFFEIGLSIWDIAAGSLLISEAGGMVSDFTGGSDHLATGNIVAGTQNIHALILNTVKKSFQGTIDS
ncbi:MAG: inositol monophosphatase [Nitrospirota bacterium]|nr:MAG: inositol monophosphatase [Nitrospirota bacterium]